MKCQRIALSRSRGVPPKPVLVWIGCEVVTEALGIPEFREQKSARTVDVGLFDVEQESLQDLGVVVFPERLGYCAIELVGCGVDRASASVYANRPVTTRNEEHQGSLGIALDVLIGLKQLVARDVGNHQAFFVEDFYETGMATLGRSVAIARIVRCGEHGERRRTDEILNHRIEFAVDLLGHSFEWLTKLLLSLIHWKLPSPQPGR